MAFDLWRMKQRLAVFKFSLSSSVSLVASFSFIVSAQPLYSPQHRERRWSHSKFSSSCKITSSTPTLLGSLQNILTLRQPPAISLSSPTRNLDICFASAGNTRTFFRNSLTRRQLLGTLADHHPQPLTGAYRYLHGNCPSGLSFAQMFIRWRSIQVVTSYLWPTSVGLHLPQCLMFGRSSREKLLGVALHSTHLVH